MIISMEKIDIDFIIIIILIIIKDNNNKLELFFIIIIIREFDNISFLRIYLLI
jgi:hypothetical protein